MDRDNLKDKIKHLVYEIVLPVYLWSIGCKTLEEYITNIESDYVEMNKSCEKESDNSE